MLEVGWHRRLGEEWVWTKSPVRLLSQNQAGKQEEDWDHTYEWFVFSIPVAENSKWVIDPISWV